MTTKEKNPISEISTNGKAFVDASGKRFMVRGIALSTAMKMDDTNDLLADANHDYIKNIILPHFTYMGVNTVRVYQVDPTQSHKKVMNLLADNGIYVMVGLATQDISVDRMDPHYTSALYQRGTDVIDEFQQYSNTLVFSVGNEVIFPGEMYAILKKKGVLHSGAATAVLENSCAAVIKSFIRDMKAYLKSNGYRQIPVGMAMQDGAQVSMPDSNLIGTNVVAQYYAAGSADERADYIGINTYRYVNPSTGHGPLNAYDGLAAEVSTLPVPVFLTESGGLNIPAHETVPNSSRDWTIVTQVFNNPTLYQQLSGQIAFEFFEKDAYHGLFVQNSDPTKDLKIFTYGDKNKYDGGYNQLAAQFQTAKRISVPPAGTATSPSTAPANFNPSLLPSPKPTIPVSIENYAAVELKVVQNTSVIATLPRATNASTPSSTSVVVANLWPLLIQQEVNPTDWVPVCQVATSALVANAVIKNNVTWGSGVACPVG
jgi:1,3-beta-glucanosyltransferase GAS1